MPIHRALIRIVFWMHNYTRDVNLQDEGAMCVSPLPNNDTLLSQLSVQTLPFMCIYST